VLFRVNMYRQGREKRLEAVRSVQRVALFAAVLCVNAVVIGLFIFAIAMSDRGIAAAETRLSATEQALDRVVSEQGGSTSEEELEVVRMRAERVLWSRVMRVVARLTPEQMWLPRMRLTEGDVGGGIRVPGLKLSGRMTAASEEEGVNVLMGFLNALRGDEYFRGHFLEPKLLRSTWLSEDGSRYLEFDVFTPLNTPDAVASGGTPIPDTGWNRVDPPGLDEDDVEYEDSGEVSERTS
jgi:hypothetical protein